MIRKAIIIPTFVMILATMICSAQKSGDARIIDSRHYSSVFGETRNFRIFLPPGYDANSGKRYPVIYYYHGWSQRYFGSGPDSYAGVDSGDENGGDNILNYVSKHDVIVVKADGYNRSPGEEYYLRPYNVSPVESFRQFPEYFPELVKFIDENYRTIPDREHRAISGLSMGGFMTFWIGAKYPHMLIAAGNFCGSPEFWAGPHDYPSEYRHRDMYNNFRGMNVRLNYGDKDFIRYYHRDLNKVWTRILDNYEYQVYDAEHSTCGLSDMFDFIMKTFENPPVRPAMWYHIDVYPTFSVWDYEVSTDRDVPGFTVIEKADQRGFKCSVRKHLPDGELLKFVRVKVTTPPMYEKNAAYTVSDFDTDNSKTATYTINSDESGRLKLHFNGSSHEIGINRAGDKANLTVASFTVDNMLFPTLKKDISLKISLLNKGNAAAEGVTAVLTAMNSETVFKTNAADYGTIGTSMSAAGKPYVFRVNADSAEIERFTITIRDRNNNEWKETFELPLHPDLKEIKDFEIADGRKVTFSAGGNQVETSVLGSGNGDGIINPGESFVVLVRDSGKLYRAYLDEADEFINPYGLNKRESDDWGSYDHVGGSAKYSVPVVSSDCPRNHASEFLAEYWLPDYPNHIIVRGKVKVKISGNDATPPSVEWVRIPGDNILQVKLFDGSPVKEVRAKLFNRDHPEKNFEAVLADSGNGRDINQGDNVFSFFIEQRRFGIYTVEITASDSFGNTATYKSPGQYVIH